MLSVPLPQILWGKLVKRSFKHLKACPGKSEKMVGMIPEQKCRNEWSGEPKSSPHFGPDMNHPEIIDTVLLYPPTFEQKIKTEPGVQPDPQMDLDSNSNNSLDELQRSLFQIVQDQVGLTHIDIQNLMKQIRKLSELVSDIIKAQTVDETPEDPPSPDLKIKTESVGRNDLPSINFGKILGQTGIPRLEHVEKNEPDSEPRIGPSNMRLRQTPRRAQSSPIKKERGADMATCISRCFVKIHEITKLAYPLNHPSNHQSNRPKPEASLRRPWQNRRPMNINSRAQPSRKPRVKIPEHVKRANSRTTHATIISTTHSQFGKAQMHVRADSILASWLATSRCLATNLGTPSKPDYYKQVHRVRHKTHTRTVMSPNNHGHSRPHLQEPGVNPVANGHLTANKTHNIDASTNSNSIQNGHTNEPPIDNAAPYQQGSTAPPRSKRVAICRIDTRQPKRPRMRMVKSRGAHSRRSGSRSSSFRNQEPVFSRGSAPALTLVSTHASLMSSSDPSVGCSSLLSPLSVDFNTVTTNHARALSTRAPTERVQTSLSILQNVPVVKQEDLAPQTSVDMEFDYPTESSLAQTFAHPVDSSLSANQSHSPVKPLLPIPPIPHISIPSLSQLPTNNTPLAPLSTNSALSPLFASPSFSPLSTNSSFSPLSTDHALSPLSTNSSFSTSSSTLCHSLLPSTSPLPHLISLTSPAITSSTTSTVDVSSLPNAFSLTPSATFATPSVSFSSHVIQHSMAKPEATESLAIGSPETSSSMSMQIDLIEPPATEIDSRCSEFIKSPPSGGASAPPTAMQLFSLPGHQDNHQPNDNALRCSIFRASPDLLPKIAPVLESIKSSEDDIQETLLHQQEDFGGFFLDVPAMHGQLGQC